MAKAQGRIFLKTDGGARDIDRMVAVETRATFYPTSTTSDRAVSVVFHYRASDDTIDVFVSQDDGRGGNTTLLSATVPNHDAPTDQAQPATAEAPTST